MNAGERCVKRMDGCQGEKCITVGENVEKLWNRLVLMVTEELLETSTSNGGIGADEWSAYRPGTGVTVVRVSCLCCHVDCCANCECVRFDIRSCTWGEKCNNKVTERQM